MVAEGPTGYQPVAQMMCRLVALLTIPFWNGSVHCVAQSILRREIEVHANGIQLAEALSLVARDGHFKLSYNAASVNGDSLVNLSANGTVGSVLRGLLDENIEIKESGEHIILLDPRGAKRSFTINGHVLDAKTGAPLAQASVYAVNVREATTTNVAGQFTLEVAGKGELLAVLISRATYHDTIVHVGANGDVGNIRLSPRDKFERIEPLCLQERCDVEDIGIAKLLVSANQMDQAANLGFTERSKFQASLWPSVGTNGRVSGVFVNQYSFNFLAGYSRGLEGLELGVGVNIERNYVKGFQVAGMANLVGGDTKGAQIAGFHNHTMHSLEGLQIAGFANTVWDTLSGVQIAGGANMVRGGMRGTQIAGAFNVATQDVNGVQFAGGINVTLRDVHKTQAAGALNYGRNVTGAQVAGGVNVALGTVGGGQVAGGINYARDITGGQVGFGVNVAVDTVRGGQVGVLNFGRVVKGGQVGILNFSDTITGASVGILSFAWRGYHRFDLVSNDAMPLSLQFRTGTRGFHNILGYSPAVTSDGRWGFLYGFGTEPRIGKHGFLNIDLTAEQIMEQEEWVDAVNILGRFGISGGIAVENTLMISAGPVLNMLVSDWGDPDTHAHLSGLPPSAPLMERYYGDTHIVGWYGWRASLGLRF
ncbi:MAG: hypothetical protein KA941_02750 [Flavobacteriales bacterium]|nr:hypothetical protein [Flavobacteriales bacterium]